MRRIGDLFKELGFNKDSSLDVQKAFVRHLVKAAENNRPAEIALAPERKASEAQLSFDASVLGVAPVEASRRKTKSR